MLVIWAYRILIYITVQLPFTDVVYFKPEYKLRYAWNFYQVLQTWQSGIKKSKHLHIDNKTNGQ